MFRALPLVLLVPLALLAFPGYAQDGEIDLASSYGTEDFVEIATGAPTSRALAPAVTSVITADDIRTMGARTLDEVLETVPGLHVAYSPIGYNSLYVLRGIYSQFNPEILVLINGVPLKHLFSGNRSYAWGSMPVQAIARIEVMRGPGSALYGADAFAGVIDITTKTGRDIDGTEFGVRAGSFDTREGWLLYGGQWGAVETAFALEIGSSDGADEGIDIDAQSQLDALLGTQASLAPGSVNLQHDSVEARLDLAVRDWRLRLGYQGRDLGTGAGAAQALDPAGNLEGTRFNADLNYEHLEIVDNWDLTARIHYLHSRIELNQRLFPPGSFGGLFPVGVIGNPQGVEQQSGANLSLSYRGWDEHRVLFGLGHHYGRLTGIRETKNFSSNGAFPMPLPAGLTDVSGDPGQVFLLPQNREVYYGLIQDEWHLHPDWIFTVGGRYDSYSDTGDTFNPRLALVWQTNYRLTTKLLYGRGFRAPSFQELHLLNNPVGLGNPALDPARIATTELAFNYQATSELWGALNIFEYTISDDIRIVPDPSPAVTVTAQNTGRQRGRGFELEAGWRPRTDLRLLGHYALQRSIDRVTEEEIGQAPRHQVYTRAEWTFIRSWNLMAQVNYIADRARAAGDARPEIDDYTTLDLTLGRSDRAQRWGFAVSIKNLFDADVREPSPAPGLIPDDLPLPGRAVFVETRLTL